MSSPATAAAARRLPWRADEATAAAGSARGVDAAWIRLLVFAGLAAFAAVHWAALVRDPPVARMLAAVAVITAGGVGLILIGRSEFARSRRDAGRAGRAALAAACAAVALAATVAGLVVIGFPLELFLPTGWGRLASEIDSGLAGLVGEIPFPYDGANGWSRLLLLVGGPLTIGLASALAFWPARRHAAALRVAALAVLVTSYAIAVIMYPPGAPLVRGLVLLALVAAWLWLPGMARREALGAGALVLVAAALSLPVAAQLDSGSPWLRYDQWSLPRERDAVTYRWDHSYGPIDWPREGTTLFEVKSSEPHYWRTAVLEHFDGYRWERAVDPTFGELELPSLVEKSKGFAFQVDPRWVVDIAVTVRALESQFVVGVGTPLQIGGLSEAQRTPAGDAMLLTRSLDEGDGYSVTGYAPDPSAQEMRAAPQHYPRVLARFVQLGVPGPATIRHQGASALHRTERVEIPLYGREQAGLAEAERALRASPYARTYRLAHDLAAGSPTAFDTVQSVEDYLLDNYSYSESPPVRGNPLPAFLFKDRAGYCQQFSGAMALMLRMDGIPARVVSGFGPGQPNDAGDGYIVQDFDAHSWVEVYFPRIGWVTFDPTPALAPAGSQTADRDEAARGRFGAAPTQGVGRRSYTPPKPERGGGAGGGPGLWVVPGLAGLAIAALAVAAALLALRHRRRPPAAAAAAQLRELRAAAAALGWSAGERQTLLSLERRLRGLGLTGAASYVARLRAGRFARRDPGPPGLRERRALRRDLAWNRGIRGRLRALLAIPPGGPT